MPNRVVAGWVAMAAAAWFSQEACAMYHPGAGRWLQRDPAGYVDGPNMHEYARSRPTRGTDPAGLTMGPCCCAANPGDCTLEYSSGPGVDATMQTLPRRRGFSQQFWKRYYVTLRSKSGQNTSGCSIRQSARTEWTYVNPADAKPHPSEFYQNKPRNKPSFKSEARGSVVVDTDPDDYTGEENEYIPVALPNGEEGYAPQINDRPGLYVPSPNGHKNKVSAYGFRAENWVAEAYTVRGTMEMSVTWDWDKNHLTYHVLSSDGKIKEDSAADSR